MCGRYDFIWIFKLSDQPRSVMQSEEQGRPPRGGISKVKLAIGAASLFLFIVGIKRSYRTDDSEDQPDERESSAAGERGRELLRLRKPAGNPRSRPPARGDIDSGR